MDLINFSFVLVTFLWSKAEARDNLWSIDNINEIIEDARHYNFTSQSCNRPCKQHSLPRRCYYRFKVKPKMKDSDVPEIRINNRTPGPSITVCLNDIVVVEVRNKIANQTLAMHWHGIEHKDSPHMDGVPMVTQCPIQPDSAYIYYFQAALPGTFFYHAHSLSQQTDGVFGAIIVKQTKSLETHTSYYDFDLDEDHIIIISASFSTFLTGKTAGTVHLIPNYLAINGMANKYKLIVLEDYVYRFRLINAIAMECPVLIYIEGHNMTAIAADGRPVRPVNAKYFILYPGERLDIALSADQPINGYWMRVRGIAGVCLNREGAAKVLYSGFNYSSMVYNKKESKQSHLVNLETVPTGQMMQSAVDTDGEHISRSVFLQIDKDTVKMHNDITHFEFISDAYPRKHIFPDSLIVNPHGYVQINGKSFLYPNTPILLNPRQVYKENVCRVGAEDQQPLTQCIHIIALKPNEIVELVLLNEGFNSNESFTFHMHGRGMEVLETFKSPDRTPITKNLFLDMHQNGHIVRNTLNPPIKDTVSVPNKGFVIVKIRENIGTWLLECRACSLYTAPTAVILRSIQVLPKGFANSVPSCKGEMESDEVAF